MNILSSKGFELAVRSLDASSLRQKVIANNIANVDTPHFKRSDVRFEEMLRQELGEAGSPGISAYRTHSRHLPFQQERSVAEPIVMTDESSAMNNNRNNVDIDFEMALMAKNQLAYNTMIQQVNHDIKKLRTAIGGRV